MVRKDDVQETVEETGQTPGVPLDGLDGLEGGGLNVAHEALERHACRRGEQAALRWLDANGTTAELTFTELARLTRRFANVLEGMAVEPDQRVLALLDDRPELYVAGLGTLRYGAVFGVLPGGLTPALLRTHLAIGEPRILLTTASTYQREVRWLRSQMEALDHILVVGEDGGPTRIEHTLDWNGLIHDTEAVHAMAATDPDDPAILCFERTPRGETTCRQYGHEAVLLGHIDPAARGVASGFLDHLDTLVRGEAVVIRPTP